MVFDRFQRYVEILEPGFHMIVMIIAIAKNGCDDPDDHVETPIFFLVTIVTIRIHHSLGDRN